MADERKGVGLPGGAASKGGRARAKILSPDERSQIARQAAESRWEKAGRGRLVPGVLCGSPDNPLTIGNIEIPCYVLDDERRVLVQRGMIDALGMSRGSSGGTGGDRLAKFAAGERLSSFMSKDLMLVTKNPIRFRAPNGQTAYGYEATVLADICEAVLAARSEGELQKQQEHIAQKCEMLVRAFAKVGIVALVDEVTGYQYMRQRTALEELLRELLSDELRRWVKTFPGAYFRELCRIRGVPYRPDMKLPQYFGHLTNDVIYSRLAPSVLEALRQRNPANESGRRSARHHQWLSEGVGHPKLLQHLGLVIGLLKISDDWDTFTRRLNVAAPPYGDSPLFAGVEEE